MLVKEEKLIKRIANVQFCEIIDKIIEENTLC